MKQLIFRILVAAAVALAPTVGLTQTGVVISGSGAPPKAGTQVKSIEGVGGTSSYTPSTVINPDASKTDGMQNNALDASSQQKSGNAAALAAMAVMMGIAAATCPACGVRGTCGICAASTAGAAASGLAAGQMSGAKQKSDQQKMDVNPTLKPETTEYFDSEAKAEAAKKMNKAAKGGATVSPDLETITTADGRTLNTAKAFTSGAGLNSAELAALKDMKAKAQEAAAKAALAGKDSTPGGDDGMPGGGGGVKTASTETTTAVGGGFGVKRDPAAVAGAFKDYNGDKIGVASDSMFNMIKRRYSFEASRDAFAPNGK